MEGSPLNRIARSALLILAALFCAIAAPAVRAQNIPDAVVQSSEPDAGAIDNFLRPASGKSPLDNLASPEMTAKARKILAEPLQRSSTRPSSGFRRAYSQAIIAKVGPLTKDANDEVAVNTLRLAGLLGTKEGLDLAQAGLDDKRESVRVAAANAISVALASAQGAGTPLLQSNITGALDKLNATLSAEKSPRVLEAMSLALDDAMHIPVSLLGGVRERAMDILNAQASRLAKEAAGPEFDPFFGHVAKALSDALALSDKFPLKQANDAAGVAGDIINRATRRVGSELTEAQRAELALVVEQSESVIKYAGGGKNYGLGALIRTSDEAKFKTKANDLFQDLKNNPFNLPPDRYPPKAP